jgi:TP901 family phage tail tape measure protein
MATKAELEFLVKMKDEMTAVLGNIAQGMTATAKATQGFQSALGQMTTATRAVAQANTQMAQTMAAASQQIGRNTTQVQQQTNAMQNLHRAAVQAGAALTSAFAANMVAREPLDKFRQYERGIADVARVLNLTSGQTAQFSKDFDNLSKSLGAIPMERLLKLAGQAATLGFDSTKDVLAFTAAIGKLETTSTTLGEDSAATIAALIQITGEGAKQVNTLVSVLAKLSTAASAPDKLIINTASQIGQATAQFNLGTTSLLGFAAASASLKFPPELFSSALSRTLQALNDAVIGNTSGFRQLSQITGLTQQQFKDLLKNDPSQALIIFSEVLRDIGASGKSVTTFLTQFQLQAVENVRVLGLMGDKSERFRAAIEMARREAGLPMEIDRQFAVVMQTYNATVIAFTNSWGRLQKTLGGALAPGVTAVLKGIGAAFDSMIQSFLQWSGTTQQIVAWTAVLLPALFGVGLAIAALKMALSVPLFGAFVIGAGKAATATAGVGVAVTAFVARFAILGTVSVLVKSIAAAMSILIATFGAIPVAIAGASVLVAGAAYFVITKWDEVKQWFAEVWSRGITGAMQSAVDGAKQIWTDFWNWLSRNGGNAPKIETPQTGARGPADQGDRALAAQPRVFQPELKNNVAGVTALDKKYIEVIQSLDVYTKKLAQIKEQEAAIAGLRNLKPGDELYRSEEEINRIAGLVEMEKQRMNLTTLRLKELQEEQAAARAVTAEQRNLLEIETEIRKAREARGALTEEESAELRQQVSVLQGIRKGNAYADQVRELNNQIAAGRALTALDKERVAIQQTLSEFIRQNDQLTALQAAGLAGQIATLKQIENFNALRDRVDPIGGANRTYLDDVRTLNQALRDGTISAQQYQQMLAMLNRTTLEARDPIASQVQSMREAADLARIQGDYREADRKTLSTIIELQRKGVSVTQEQRLAMQEYNRALQDAEKSSSSGLTGWMNSVGSLRDNLLDVTKDFASSLSSAISGAFQGKGFNIGKLLGDLGGKLLDVSINQAMKGLIQSTGLDKMFGNPSDDLDRARQLADKLAGLNTIQAATAVVNASSVSINGQGLGPVADIRGTPLAPPSGSGSGSGLGFDPAAFGSAVRTMPEAGRAVDLASNLLGQNERTNTGSINSYLAAGGVNLNAAQTAWCAAFVNSSLSQIGIQGTGSNVATSFLNWGTKVDPSQVMRGDVLVEGRGLAAGQLGGHVGFATGKTRMNNGEMQYESLSGNLSNKVGTEWLGSGDFEARRASMSAAQAQIQAASQQQIQTATATQQQITQIQQQGGASQVQAAQSISSEISTISSSENGTLPFQNLSSAIQDAGSKAQSAAASFQQVGPAVQQAGQNAGTAAPQVSQAGFGLGSLVGPLAQLVPGLGQFSGIITQLLNSLTSGLGGGGGGGGGGGLFGFIGSLFGGIFHGGGVVGQGGTPALLPAGLFTHAPRYHSGLKGNEFPAILQRGESVLTKDQSRQVNNSLSAKSGGGTVRMGDTNIMVETKGSSGDAGADAMNAQMIAESIDVAVQKRLSEFVTTQSRNGGLFSRMSRGM